MAQVGFKAGLLAAVFVLASACAASAQGPYKPPRLSDGKPDLQGFWSNATLTRLERDATYGERLALTKEEAAKLEGDTATRNARLNAPTNPELLKVWTDPNRGVDNADDCRSGSRGAACGYNAGWTDPGDLVMRVRGEPRTSLITFPKNGRVPVRNQAGAPTAAQRAAAARAAANEGGEGDTRPQRPGANDNPEGRSLGERCIMSFGSSSGPIMQSQLYNNTYQFVQTKDHVAIVVEMVHDVRVVRLNAAHRTDGVRPYMGDSIGWWDGDTLVVETTHFHPSQNLRGSSANLKMTERFTRTAPDRLLYQFKAEDPGVFAEPWGGEYEFSKASGAVYEYACHEGNYGLENILAGARAEEAAARTAAGGRAGTQ